MPPATELTEEIPFEVRAAGPAAPGTSNLIEVTATHDPRAGEHLFHPDRREVPSGWVTFRLNNRSPAAHFIYIVKVPDRITPEDYHESITLPYQQVIYNLKDPDFDGDPFAPFGAFPDWFFEGEVEFPGGVGLVSPRLSAEATLDLEPGTYIIECYVKEDDGTFHSTLGMIERIVVTDEESPASAPRQSLEMNLSSTDGIEITDEIRPGRHTVAVSFEDQADYDGLGHDVHLVRLGDASLEEVAEWMNPFAPVGMIDDVRVRAPAEFLGGVQDMRAGTTGYFTAQLTPGRYAWISEVPDPIGAGLVKTFTVPADPRSGE